METVLALNPFDDGFNESQDIDYRPSRALGFTSDGNILCKKRIKEWPMFRFLTTFYHNTWLMMVITILFVSSVTTLTRTSWSAIRSNRLTKSILTFIMMIIESLWKLLGTAFGHSSFSRSTSLLSNVSNTSWLMLSTVMLSAFSSVLLPFFMKPIPKEVVNSWEDLYHRKDLKTAVFRWSSLYQYIEYYKDTEEMAREFSTRFEDLYILLSDDVDDDFAIKNQLTIPDNKVFKDRK